MREQSNFFLISAHKVAHQDDSKQFAKRKSSAQISSYVFVCGTRFITLASISLFLFNTRHEASGVGPRAHISHTPKLIFELFPRIPLVGVEQEKRQINSGMETEGANVISQARPGVIASI